MKFSNSFEIFLGILLIIVTGVLTVEITNFQVPDYVVIKDDAPDDILLDCEYQLESGETNLVIKWLKDGEIIYQWIQGMSPKPFPNIRIDIDVNYVASEDELQKHRALLIQNPNWNVTGTYKCLVQTRQSTSSREGHLQIIDVSNITLDLIEDVDEDDVDVTCSVENMFPQPKLRIKNGEENVHIRTEELIRKENGYFDVTALGILKNTEKHDEGLSCLLYVPGSNYTYTHTNGSGSRSLHLSLLISFFIFMLCT